MSLFRHYKILKQRVHLHEAILLYFIGLSVVPNVTKINHPSGGLLPICYSPCFWGHWGSNW